MRFEVIGTVTMHVHKVFEADSIEDASEQVEAWKTWNAESLIDMMRVMEQAVELDQPEKVPNVKKRK